MNKEEVANVAVQPAILYIVSLMSIPLLHWIVPMTISDMPGVPWAGGVLFLLAWLFWLWGAVTMRRARTNILPINPTTTLVAVGPFRRSRNPLYAALFVTIIAFTVLWNTWWGFMVIVPYQFAMHYWVVLREELYLEARFGDAYREYCRSVRRWF